MAQAATHAASEIDSSYAWLRLGVCVALSTLGGVGMWCVVVALPSVQADFNVSRAEVSLGYTATMLGFCAGGIVMGRLVDTRGVVFAVGLSAVMLGAGFILGSFAPSLWVFAVTQGVLIGFGAAATFAPLVADISHWFEKRRGVAVAICASGNYLAGAIWPPLLESFIRGYGWRATFLAVGAMCVATMLPLAWALRRKIAVHETTAADSGAATQMANIGISPNALQAILAVAGLACCVAMSMPQVHIVAYCGDLGYGAARGAEMLSLMLGFGIVSRVASGWIADRIGGVKTLLLGSCLQGLALVMYLNADGLTSLYVVSALFGLFQGGIVPSYALIVREYFPPREAGARVGTAISATIIGMALGGWMGGALFDLTGSYRAAFINGLAWNLLNVAVAWWLLTRQGRRLAAA
jgi:MFS family permease